MEYFLGIDGGGTNTIFILSDGLGNILGWNKQTTMYYLEVGFDGIINVIDKGINEIQNSTGIGLSQITHVFVGCPGYGDVKSVTERIFELISKYFKNIDFSIGNDTENSMAGSLAGENGINIVAGTGSMTTGIDKEGKILRAGGWSYLFGADECSAYWLSNNMLRLFVRQADGRDEKGLLYYTLKDKLKLERDDEILEKTIEKWEFKRSKIASMAVFLYELAELNDPHSIELYKKGAKELAELVIAIYNQIYVGKTVKVSYSGSVIVDNKYVIGPLMEFLKAYDIKISKPIFQPDIGSIILAMKNSNVDISDSVLNNFKTFDRLERN